MSCPYYKWNGGILGDYWCIKNDSRVDNNTYYNYCRDYNYDNCSIYRYNSNGSGCFISTIVCNILGKDDNDKVLDNLRSFRDNVLQKDDKYADLLKDYDNIGPVVACRLMNDSSRKDMAEGLYNYVLLPISKNIENKKYDRAIRNYEIMVLSLINYYGLKHGYNELKDRGYGYGEGEFNILEAGHGRVRKRSNKLNYS